MYSKYWNVVQTTNYAMCLYMYVRMVGKRIYCVNEFHSHAFINKNFSGFECEHKRRKKTHTLKYAFTYNGQNFIGFDVLCIVYCQVFKRNMGIQQKQQQQQQK